MAEQAGAKTQVTGLVGAGAIVLILVVVPGLLKNLPQPALAAVVIAASLSLADARDQPEVQPDAHQEDRDQRHDRRGFVDERREDERQQRDATIASRASTSMHGRAPVSR